VKFKRHIGRIYRLRLQCRRITQARKSKKFCLFYLIPLSCWFYEWLILRPSRLRWYFLPKRRLTFTELHDVITEKADLFTYINATVDCCTCCQLVPIWFGPPVLHVYHVTYLRGFEDVGSSGKASNLFLEMPVRIPVGTPTVLIEFFRKFPQPFQTVFLVTPQIRRCWLPPTSFLLYYSPNVLPLEVM
jgi:hypothetical protein